MDYDHTAFIRSEIVRPLQSRLFELLRVNELLINFRGRVGLHLADWEVEFRGTFQASKKDNMTPVGQHHYQKAIIWINSEVDTMFVHRDEFQFSIRSFSNPERWAEAIEGSAFILYRVLEPVLEHGFCSHCDKPHTRDDEGALLCGCIAKAVQDAK